MSFYPTENAVQLIERAQHLLLRIECALTSLKQGETKQSFDRFGILEQLLDYFQSSLNAHITLLRMIRHEPDLAPACRRFALVLDHTAEIFLYIEEAVAQRSVPPSEQSYLSKRLRGSSLKVIDVYRAMDLAFAHLMRLHFGPYYPYHFAVTGICREMETHSFRAVTNTEDSRIAVVTVPTIEVTRTRMWGGLAHEAAHHRIFRFNDVLSKDQKREFNRRTLVFLNDLANLLYSRRFTQCNPLQQGTMLDQLEEIMCDIASIRTVGIASCFSLVLSANPFRHLSPDSNHPPLVVRMRYMLELLQGLKPTRSYSADLKRLIGLYNDYVIEIPYNSAQSNYCRRYVALVERHIRLLARLVNKFMLSASPKNLFSAHKWETAIRILEKGKVTQEDLDLISLLNVGCARRIRTFDDLRTQAEIERCSPASLRESQVTYTAQIVDGVVRLLSSTQDQASPLESDNSATPPTRL